MYEVEGGLYRQEGFCGIPKYAHSDRRNGRNERLFLGTVLNQQAPVSNGFSCLSVCMQDRYGTSVQGLQRPCGSLAEALRAKSGLRESYLYAVRVTPSVSSARSRGCARRSGRSLT